MSDYATLQADVANYLGRDDLTAEIPTFIRTAESTLYRRVRNQSMIRVCSATATETLPGGEYVVSLPSDFMALKTVESGGVPLTQDSIRRLNNDSIRKYALTGGMMAVSPDSLSVDIYYYAKPIAVEGDPNNWFISNAYDALLWGSVRQGQLYIRDMEAATMANDEFQNLLAQLIEDAVTEEYSQDGIVMRRG